MDVWARRMRQLPASSSTARAPTPGAGSSATPSPPRAGWWRTARLSPIVGGDRVDLVTKDIYKDFDLELEWKVGPVGNSGVMYDVAETEPETYYTGPEMQVLDDAGHKDGQDSEDVGGLALRADRAVGEGREAGRGMEQGAAREEGQPRRALAERHEDRGVRAGQPRPRRAHRGQQVQGVAALRARRARGTSCCSTTATRPGSATCGSRARRSRRRASCDTARGRGPAPECPARPAPRAAARTCRPRPRRSCA